ncbi:MULTISPECIES: hypothetical protein [unclassified Pseudomonas]|jgi:hypothetical protein|uniref:hypothetical protein n=1 Tax=Pseudomonas sp. A-R-26 TaxID=2832404 RepID=UPI001CBF00E4|nr:hypothetical protein [Pseudomonas sp. A-R-26]
MNNITAVLGLLFFYTHFGHAQATSVEVPVVTSKAMTIVFEPPQGKEKEFLEQFVQSQATYMKTYGRSAKAGVKVINLVPTEPGEPLIHLMIYQDMAAYERAKKIFASREALAGYIDGHVKAYGGYDIPKEYLASSKVYLSNVLTD